jgi:hypothetical protein
MTRNKRINNEQPAPEESVVATTEEVVTEGAKTEDLSPAPSDPVSLEVTASEEPVSPAPAAKPEKIQTDFREKLARKTDQQDVFVPSNPAALEKAAADVAKESGFELNRGTSIGARLMARAQKRF